MVVSEDQVLPTSSVEWMTDGPRAMDALLALEMLVLSLDEHEDPRSVVAVLKPSVMALVQRYDAQLSPLFGWLQALLERLSHHAQQWDNALIAALLRMVDFLKAWDHDAVAAYPLLALLMADLPEPPPKIEKELVEEEMAPSVEPLSADQSLLTQKKEIPPDAVLPERAVLADQEAASEPATGSHEELVQPLSIAFQRQGPDPFTLTLAHLFDCGSRLSQPVTNDSGHRQQGEDWVRFEGALQELNHWALDQRKVAGPDWARRVVQLGEEVAARHHQVIHFDCHDRGVAWDAERIEPLLQVLDIWFDFVVGWGVVQGGLSHVSVWVVETGQGHALRIKDDGPGLEREQLLQQAVALGLMESGSMATREYGTLIFERRWRFSQEIPAAARLPELRQRLHALGGQVALASKRGLGILCEMKWPPLGCFFQGVEVVSGLCQAVVPLFFMQEATPFARHDLLLSEQGALRLHLRGKSYCALTLERLMGQAEREDEVTSGMALLLEQDGRRLAVLVDRVQSPRCCFLQKLEQHHQRVFGLLGATLTAQNAVWQVLNISELMESV